MRQQTNYNGDIVSTKTVALDSQQAVIHKHLFKPRVLLVEDIPLIQKIHSTLLKNLGCVIDLAANGRSALELSCKKYDLIFMDIKLPDMTGIEICKILRDKGESIPIIALTTESIDIKQYCFNAGMNDFLQKPVSIEVLNSVLQRWLSSL